MRISHRYRLIFFSNPKTGSSTIRKCLDPFSDVDVMGRLRDHPSYPHMRPVEVRSRFAQYGWDFGGYSRFVCIRNPWARLVSLYHYLFRKSEPPPFEEWLASLDGSGPRKWSIFGSDSLERFIKDADGNVLVDRVLRTEEIDQVLLPYLRSLGLPIPQGADLQRHNTTGTGSGYQEYYTPASVALVRRLYRYEIVHFGYEFGDPA